MKTISIDRLLNSVGTHTFIDYYFEFKELNNRIKEMLESKRKDDGNDE